MGGTILYIATTDKRLFRYDPLKNTLTLIVNNLPANMQALDMRSDGLLMMGIHDSILLRAYDPLKKLFVGSKNTTTIYNNVEGIAWP
jgi:hypothetical protein